MVKGKFGAWIPSLRLNQVSGLISALLFVLGGVLGGCQNSPYYSVGIATRSDSGGGAPQFASGTGSGGGYEGRVIYNSIDSLNPCSILGGDGKPLPNAQLAITDSASGARAELERSTCLNLAVPQPLKMSELQFTPGGNGALTYKGMTFKPATTNLEQSSGSYDQAPWVLGAASVTSNAALAPNGTQTAVLFKEDTSNTWHSIDQPVNAPVDLPYSCSVFVRAAMERTQVLLKLYEKTSFSDDFYVGLDLTTGATLPGSSGTGVLFSAGAQAYSGGWYRLSLSGQLHPSSSGNQPDCSLYIAKQLQPEMTFYMGDGAGSVYFWGFQLESGAAVTPYVNTVGFAP